MIADVSKIICLYLNIGFRVLRERKAILLICKFVYVGLGLWAQAAQRD